MEAIPKIAALERALTSPAQGVGPASHGGAGQSPDDLVDRFEALMQGRGGPADASGLPLQPSPVVTAIGNLADDSNSVAEENDALYETDDMSAGEVSMRMSALAQEMRLVGLRLKAYTEMSKQSREGVQTLMRS